MRCAKCKQEKVRNRATKTGFGSRCLGCHREDYRKWAAENPEKVVAARRSSYERTAEARRPKKRQQDRDYYMANRERIREDQVWKRLASRYGISKEAYDAMLDSQGGVCVLCEQSCKTGQRLNVDHDHGTGKVRGLLCRACNFRVGQIEKPGLDVILDYLAVQ